MLTTYSCPQCEKSHRLNLTRWTDCVIVDCRCKNRFMVKRNDDKTFALNKIQSMNNIFDSKMFNRISWCIILFAIIYFTWSIVDGLIG